MRRLIPLFFVVLGACRGDEDTGPPGGGGASGAPGGAGGAAHADAGQRSSSGGSGGSPSDTTDARSQDDATGLIDAATEATADARNGSCTGALVCDDFEANTAGSAPAMWSVDIGPAGAGTVKVDTTRAFSGTKSLRITVVAQQDHDRAFITRPLTGLLPTNAFFGRMMIWVVASPPGNVHWDNIRAQGVVPGGTLQGQYNYGGGSNTGNLMANYWTQSSDCWKTSKSRLVTGKWACIEWQYDGVKDEMRYWQDGQAVDDLTVLQKGDGCTGPNLWKAPTFEKLSLGWYNAQASPVAIEMWMDDVAIDTKKIGCPGL
jgi:hypothetical protein